MNKKEKIKKIKEEELIEEIKEVKLVNDDPNHIPVPGEHLR